MRKIKGYAYYYGNSWGRVHVDKNGQYGIYKKPFSKDDLKYNCVEVEIRPIPTKKRKK